MVATAASEIEAEFRKKVSSRVRLVPEGTGRFRVMTPFAFEDGDRYAIVLRRTDDKWVLSDEGHTLMHLTYWMEEGDLRQGTRAEVISNALKEFHLSESDGELLAEAGTGELGDRFFDFIQALTKVADTAILSRERVKSTFWEDLRKLVHTSAGTHLAYDDWSDPQRDPGGKYIVPIRVEREPEPLFVFGLPNEANVRDATISLLTFEKWGVRNTSLGVYEKLEEISPKVVARFSDVAGKQFSALDENRERIHDYIQRLVVAGA